MKEILFIDLETTKDHKVLDVGALYGDREYHGKSLTEIEAWLEEAEFICGHNLIAHDLPVLKKKLGEELFEGKQLIDTLLWSPLLFADRPYHKLFEGKQLINEEEYSNPLSDCKLCKALLLDELPVAHEEWGY